MFPFSWGKRRKKLLSEQANLLFQQALAMHTAGRIEQAIHGYQGVLELLPDNAEAMRLLGVAQCQRGDVGQGVDWFLKAERIAPDNALLQVNLGQAYLSQADFRAASTHLERACVLDQTCVDAHFNLGNLHLATKRPAAAIPCFARCIELRGSADDHLNLAVALLREEILDRARCEARAGVELAPTRADIWHALGNIYFANREWREAVDAFNNALGFAPDFAGAHWNKAVACLMLGDYTQGWAAFQWRPGIENFRSTQALGRLWLGGRLEGMTLLVLSEHGQGDVLQFSRYLKVLSTLGARVILETQSSLVALMRGSLPLEVIAQGGPRPPFDAYCPLLSLPFALRDQLGDSIPFPERYLVADQQKVTRWRERLALEPRLKVGLVWSSGFHPGDPDSWEIYAKRNVPLAQLSALKLEGAAFFSLQKGDEAVSNLCRLKDADWDGPEIVDWSADITDFSDTAALIECLDLVISVDTSVIHLAGALGKEAWLLNRWETCWRWTPEGESSPWYSSVKIFRQVKKGEWSAVLTKVRQELLTLLARRSGEHSESVELH